MVPQRARALDAVPLPSAVASNSPTAAVKSAIDDSIVVFRDQQMSPADRVTKLRAIGAAHFDFESMARSSLGYHWRDLTPEQRAEFVPLFTNFIEDVVLSRIQQYSVEKIRSDIKTSIVQFTRETMDGPDYAEVFSTVVLESQAQPVKASYRMHLVNGQWRIYDVTVDSISVVANYRNQFNHVITQQGYDALVALLKQKQEQLAPTLAQ